ncbi:MAG: class D sortase, partial [Anaerolineae bacterium]|nr:class D sortase [Anaerolineae bacterium]
GNTPSSPAPQPTTEPGPYSDPNGLPAGSIELPAEAVEKRKIAPQFEDNLNAAAFERSPRDGAGRIWRSFVDRSLLLLEVAAVVGLVLLGMSMVNGLSLLQEETAAAQAAAEEQRAASIPTLAPTPQLRLADVVLPTGHTPPQNGVSSFNFAEVPAALQAEVARQVFLPDNFARPVQTDDTPLRVRIPALNIDHAIVQGVDWNALQLGVGMLPNGSTPRSDGDNVVLAAHNDIYGEIFRHLDQLAEGDQIEIQTQNGSYVYIVRGTEIVAPDDVHVMQSQGTPMVTLISCYPYQVNTQRIVVFADRSDTASQ